MTETRFISVDPSTLTLWQRLTCWVIVPGSPVYIRWGAFVLACIYLNCIIDPFIAAFAPTSQLLYLSYTLDAVFWVDIMVRFHLPYVKDNVLVMDLRRIAMHNFRGFFWLDVLAVFPIEVFGYYSTDPAVRLWLPLLRMNRVVLFSFAFHLSFLVVIRVLMYLSSQLQAGFGLVMLRFGLAITLITHWCACIWYKIGCWDGCSAGQDLDSSWPSTVADQDFREMSLASRYLVSLYWSTMTTTTTGYGNIYAISDQERLFAIACCFIGQFLYGYCSGTVTSILVNANALQHQYQAKVRAVKEYMAYRHFEPDLQARVLNYYDYLWHRQSGIDAHELLQNLPVTFHAELAYEVNKEVLYKISLFQDTPSSFLQSVARALDPEIFLPGDLVVRKDDPAQEMHFIARGRVEVVSSDFGVVLESLNEGEYFGESSLIQPSPRPASIRAVTYCELYILRKRDFDDIMHHFPAVRTQILERMMAIIAQNNGAGEKRSLSPDLVQRQSILALHRPIHSTQDLDAVPLRTQPLLSPDFAARDQRDG
ncbi:hypothetical protein RI367_005967 [Sorochytrium milnesiophthora]